MKHHKILASVIALIITAVVMTTSVCLAQDNQTPIEISADQTLEWNQQDKQYTANGNVVVVQGTMTLSILYFIGAKATFSHIIHCLLE